MFENLTDKLQRAFKNLRGQGTLTEENIGEALKEIRIALLEADVNFKVVKELVDHIREKALGQEVMTALSPAEQVVKIVRDELINVLGKDTAKLKFASQPPTVVLMAGLQGSGKTTTSGKLANWLKHGGHRPMLVSVDVYRPAAREQLKVVANAIKAHLYEGKVEESNTATVERLVKEARREAINNACDVLIVDTAGRLHIDEQLMDEMQSLKKILNPQEILFVADSMTGQDAVRSADEFHKKLTLTGVVLTKMDGDARGGAALSIRNVTGQPIKFIGVGEKYDALEPFHPDRIVGRILGMGDILSLIEKAEAKLDKTQVRRVRAQGAERRRLLAGRFPRSIAASEKARLAAEHHGHDAQDRPLRQHAEGSRPCGREADQPRRSHHQLHDTLRTRSPRSHQRQPPQAHRPRLRHHRTGNQPTAAPVRPDAQDVQEHGQAQLRPPHGGDEDAGDVRMARLLFT